MPHALPPLPYAYDALEPHIDALTMEIHHSKHHQTYVNNLNAALEGTPYAEQPVESLLRQLAGLPEKLRTPGCQQWRWACQPLAVLDRDVAPGRWPSRWRPGAGHR